MQRVHAGAIMINGSSYSKKLDGKMRKRGDDN